MRLVRVDVDEQQLQKNATSSAPILGRVEVVVPELLERSRTGTPGRGGAGAVRAAAVREVLLLAREVDGAPFAELHRQLRDVLADDAIVRGDSAQVSYYGTVHYFPMSRPRQFLYPRGSPPSDMAFLPPLERRSPSRSSRSFV